MFRMHLNVKIDCYPKEHLPICPLSFITDADSVSSECELILIYNIKLTILQIVRFVLYRLVTKVTNLTV